MKSHPPTQHYLRYGGLQQSHPLTADEQLHDDTRRKLDELEDTIGEMSCSLFTAYELIWFNRFSSTHYSWPSQQQVDAHIKELEELLVILGSRR